jgi:Flp pilus assembly pilin Flp
MKTKTLIKNQEGVAAVEFAIIAPLLILLTFAIIEFGVFLFNKHVITNVSREIARAGIVARENRFIVYDDPSHCTPDYTLDQFDGTTEGNKWLINNLVTFGDPNTPQISIEILKIDASDPSNPIVGTDYVSFDDSQFCSDDTRPCNKFRCPLKVTVTFDYDFLFLSTIGIGPINMVGETVMLME